MAEGKIGGKVGFLERHQTRPLRPADRMEQWRVWHPSLVMTPRSGFDGSRLDAAVTRYCSADGSVIGVTQGGNLDIEFGQKSAGDYILFSAPTQGAGLIESRRASFSVRTGDRCYLIDGRRPTTVRSTEGFGHAYLALPRQSVIDALGFDPFEGPRSVIDSPRRGALAIEVDHLQSLILHAHELQPLELAAAAKYAQHRLLTQLGRCLSPDVGGRHELGAEAILKSARRLMESNGASPRLTTASIAAAVGCSRAHLYRVFSASGTSVAETMREIGLNRAKGMLGCPQPRSLAEIAREAGYTNESSFCRAFRASTGMTPGDYRTVARKRQLRLPKKNSPAETNC